METRWILLFSFDQRPSFSRSHRESSGPWHWWPKAKEGKKKRRKTQRKIGRKVGRKRKKNNYTFFRTAKPPLSMAHKVDCVAVKWSEHFCARLCASFCIFLCSVFVFPVFMVLLFNMFRFNAWQVDSRSTDSLTALFEGVVPIFSSSWPKYKFDRYTLCFWYKWSAGL